MIICGTAMEAPVLGTATSVLNVGQNAIDEFVSYFG